VDPLRAVAGIHFAAKGSRHCPDKIPSSPPCAHPATHGHHVPAARRSGGGGGGVRFAQGGKPIFDFAQFSIHVLVVQKNI